MRIPNPNKDMSGIVFTLIGIAALEFGLWQNSVHAGLAVGFGLIAIYLALIDTGR